MPSRRPFLRNIAVPLETISLDSVKTYEMPTNPLSVLLLNIRPLNDTGVLANYPRYRAACAALNRVTLTLNGQTIISMRGEDIATMNYLRWGILPPEANPDNVDNERRCVILPLILGARPFDKSSCFPASERGQLVLEVDFDIADTGYDGLTFSVDSIELPGAKPKEYERRVQVTQTFAATGTQDVPLVPGAPCRGILLFGTTGFAGAAPAPSWGRIKVMLDNEEAGYAAADWETLLAEPFIFQGRSQSLAEHKHTVNAAGAGIEETTSVFDADEDFTNYVYLDFDHTRDDEFTLDTSAAKSFKVRAEAETADAVRAIPIEVVKA